MTPELRRVVAYIAARLASGAGAANVYSYDDACYTPVTGTISQTSVAVFDHIDAAHVTGSPSGLFHHKLGAHFSVQMSGLNFSGYDHSTGTHYQGSVNGSTVQLFDGGWHHFQVT